MEPILVHGSGTTNPSKFFETHDWKNVRESVEVHRRSDRVLHQRVLPATNDYELYSHFGSGDIVVPSEDYTALNDCDKGFVTIPFQPYNDFFLSQRSRFRMRRWT